MSEIKSWIKKYKILILLGLITLGGGVLRFYDFFDLIFFEIDQARDYKLIDGILKNGLEDFPLVGPKAGGTLFRLGSIYYIPALFLSYIFGVFPYILVLPEVLLSVATIPLFFILVREFFAQRISFYLTAILAVSLLFVEYAHFSWNPNCVPFFFILMLYAALKYSQPNSKKVLWISILAVALGIGMQLHAITLIGMPLVLGIYFVVIKNKIPFKHLFITGFILMFLFSPWILNDALTKGENTKEFISSIISKGERDERGGADKKLFMDIYNSVRFYSIVLTSHNQIRELNRVESSKSLADLINKNMVASESRNSLIVGFVLLGIFLIGFYFMIKSVISLRNKDVNNKRKFNFLAIIIITQAVFFLIFFPLSLKMDSRYFLPVAIVPIVILGMGLSLIEKKYLFGKKLAFILFLIFLFLNIKGSIGWLNLIESYSFKYEKNKEFILEPYFIVTMGQWDEIVNKVVELSDKHSGNLYIQSTPYHVRSLSYLLEIEKKKPVRIMDTKNLDLSGMYFFLRESDDFKSEEPLPESVGRRFDITGQYDFGTVTLIQLKIKDTTGLVAHKKFDFSQEPKLPKCYELSYHIEARDKCMLGDVGHLFGLK